ncbi:MAG: hypothetical protein ACTS8R_04610 [Arsenophonus sp. NC-QC1-MAG3]
MQILIQAKVNAHYLFPKILKIKKVWHAGLSNLNSRLDLNDSSLVLK